MWRRLENRRSQEGEIQGGVGDSSKGKGVVQAEIISNYFFTEFPKDYGAKEMYDIFKEYGLVVEVVIPSRRDNLGKHYGFVRFRRVGDEGKLAVKLDNIFIKSKKFHANVPKFQCGGEFSGKHMKYQHSTKYHQHRGGANKQDNEYNRAGRSNHVGVAINKSYA